jgi:succinoglycan biosynthesis protein ExoA
VSDGIYLSVVVPIRNEEKHIAQTLAAMASQDYPQSRYEILVVDGNSTDQTRAVVEAFIGEHPNVNIRLLDNPGKWSSRARNIGVRAARGDLIAVIDGHVRIPDERLFAAIERLKEEHDALCLARPAPLVVPELDGGMPLWIALARKSWLGHSCNSYIYGRYEGFVDPTSSGFAYAREVFERVGYFDESFDAAEDCEFHHRMKRAGIRAYTSPALTIYSFPRETLGGLFRQTVRYGIGRARLVRKHDDALTKETLIPPAVFLLFALAPLVLAVSFWWPVLGWLYGAPIAIYLSVVLGTGFACSLRRRRLLAGLAVAAAVCTTHLGLGWGFLKTVFRPRCVLSRTAALGNPPPCPSMERR